MYAIYLYLKRIIDTEEMFSLVSFWHISLCGLFNAKDILVEKQYLYYLIDS